MLECDLLFPVKIRSGGTFSLSRSIHFGHGHITLPKPFSHDFPQRDTTSHDRIFERGGNANGVALGHDETYHITLSKPFSHAFPQRDTTSRDRIFKCGGNANGVALGHDETCHITLSKPFSHNFLQRDTTSHDRIFKRGGNANGVALGHDETLRTIVRVKDALPSSSDPFVRVDIRLNLFLAYTPSESLYQFMIDKVMVTDVGATTILLPFWGLIRIYLALGGVSYKGRGNPRAKEHSLLHDAPLYNA
jgi:hypothetical protein